MKKRWIGLLALGSTLLVGLGWWFMRQPTPVAKTRHNEIPHTQSVASTRSDAANDDRPSAPKRVVSAPFSPKSEESAASFSPLVPNYGPMIERHNAVVEIPLMDATGLPLLHLGFREPQLRIWRREGDAWLLAPGQFDFERSVLVAGQGADRGLEPGEHEVAVSLGSYGKASAKFSVGGTDDSQSPTLQLEGQQRWITLEFVDKAGRPVPYISHMPQFTCAWTRQISRRKESLPSFLSEPPNLVNRGPIVEEEIEDLEEFHMRRTQRIPTDNGQVRLQVVAGAKGSLSIEFDAKLFVTKEFSIRSRFDGPEWDRYTIPLTLHPKYEQRVMKLRESVNRGANSSAGENRPAVPDPFDTSTIQVGQTRVIVTAAQGSPLKPVRASHSSSPLRKVFHPGGLTWFNDYLPKRPLNVLASDQEFFRPAPIQIAHRENSIVRVPLIEGPVKCRIEAVLTPTLAAWARAVSFALQGEGKSGLQLPSGAHQRTRPAYRKGTRFHYDTSLTAEWAQKLSKPTNLFIGLSRHGDKTVRYVRQAPTGGHQVKTIQLSLSPSSRNALRGETLKLDLRQRLKTQLQNPWLVLRTVGDRGEGLPWVHGSVILASEDSTAQTCRTLLTAMADQQQEFALPKQHARLLKPNAAEIEPPPEMLTEFDPFSQRPHSARTDGFVDIDYLRPKEFLKCAPLPDRETLASYLDPDLLSRMSAKSLQRLWVQGAWYDTRSRIASDRDGYVLDTKTQLIPGKLYVLYLWSKSRNDLVPDARFVFMAKPGITDLGALRLPSY